MRFDNVSKQYSGGQQALREVSFEVGAGEMLFLTGHSGAGKTTLLKLIHLAERPSRGAVLFGQQNLLRVRGRKVALHRRNVGVVFQDHRLLATVVLLADVVEAQNAHRAPVEDDAAKYRRRGRR